MRATCVLSIPSSRASPPVCIIFSSYVQVARQAYGPNAVFSAGESEGQPALSTAIGVSNVSLLTSISRTFVAPGFYFVQASLTNPLNANEVPAS